MKERSVVYTIGLLATFIVLAAVVDGQEIALNVGPGEQVAAPGQYADFVFSIDGNGVNIASNFRFKIVYDESTAVYEPLRQTGSTEAVQCTLAPGLEELSNLSTFFPDRSPGVFIVSFADTAAPLTAFGRAGVVARCKVRIKPGTPLGSYPLRCEGPASAGSIDPDKLVTATCSDGTLHVVPPEPTPTPTHTAPSATATQPSATRTPLPLCTGDETGDGSVDGNEMNDTIRAFTADDPSFNTAADSIGPDGTIDGDELNQVIRNFTRDECGLIQ